MWLSWAFLWLVATLGAARIIVPTTPSIRRIYVSSTPQIISSTTPVRRRCPDRTWRLSPKGPSCVKEFTKTKLTWNNARSECQKLGADLVQIHDAEMNELVRGLLVRRARYWIGVSDTNNDRKFKYLNGKSLSDFHPWAAGEPNNHGGNEGCLEIIGDRYGRWNDKRCSRKRPYVCELRFTSNTPPPPPVYTTPPIRQTSTSTSTTTTTTTNSTLLDENYRPDLNYTHFVLSTDLEDDDLPDHYNVSFQSWNRLFDLLTPARGNLLRLYLQSSVATHGVLTSHLVNIPVKGCLTLKFKATIPNMYIKASEDVTHQMSYYSTTSDDIWKLKSFYFNISPVPRPVRIRIHIGSRDGSGYMDVDDFRFHVGVCESGGV